jgi:predicted PurR-regulated permease PerM
VATLFWAKTVLIPVALAILLSFVLAPVAEWLERRRLGRVPAALGVSVVALMLLGVLGWVAAVQVRNLYEDRNKYAPNLTAKFQPVLRLIDRLDPSGATTRTIEGEPPPSPGEGGNNAPVPVKIERDKSIEVLQWIPTIAAPAAETLASVLLVTVLTIFLMIQRESVRDRLLALAGRRGLTATTRALEDAGRRVSKFLLLQSSTNAAMGVITGVGLWAIGVPYPALFGVLTAILRFVPFVGIWLAALLPFALAVAAFPGWGPALGVLALFGISDALMSQGLEPLIFGKGTGVSPLALLVATAFWAFLWGPVGLLLAVPLTVCLVVLGEHSHSLKFFKTLMGEEPEVDPGAKYFHRVLSREADEAAVLVSELAAQRSLLEVYDDMLLSTLAQAKAERDRGGLSPAEEREFYRVTRDVLDGVLSTYRAETGATDEPAKPAVRVIGCATKGEADRLALVMLRDVARTTGCEVEVVPAPRLAAAAADQARRDEDVVVCIAAVSPGGLAQAAGLIKQVKARVKGVKVLVGRWGITPNKTETEQFLTHAGAAKVTWTLRDTLDQFAPDGAPPKEPKQTPTATADAGKVVVPA